MDDELIIYMSDVRSVRMCSRGARDFFRRHDLDWEDFLKNGISAARLVATGDHMALQVVEATHGRKQ